MDISDLSYRIRRTIVCNRCVDDVAEGTAGDVSIREYSRLDVGLTDRGIQVWCQRHDINVAHIDFGGQRVEADFRCIEPPSQAAH